MIDSLEGLRAARAPGLPFRLRLSEEEAETLLAHQAQQHDALLLEVHHLRLEPGRLALALQVTLLGLPLAVEASGRPRLEQGRLAFELQDLLVNGAPAPAFLRQQVLHQVNARLAPEALPVVLTELELGDGWVLIAGQTKESV
jgi:hypothetical protein